MKDRRKILEAHKHSERFSYASHIQEVQGSMNVRVDPKKIQMKG